MRRSSRHLQHRRRMRWWAPWSPVCGCGLPWPCMALRMLRGQAAWQPPAERLWQPEWAGPTVAVRTIPPRVSGAPLLTRGQRHRTGGW